LLLSTAAGRSEANIMVARSIPPLRDIGADGSADAQDIDPDSATGPYEPVSPAEAPKLQALALVPSPDRIAMIGGGIAAALAGGAVGYWLGRRHTPRPARPLRKMAERFESAVELAPVAMHLLANPIVRALALRVLLRQISRRIDH
jgi:hypothetical protein